MINAENHPIIVLGVERSGTSVVDRKCHCHRLIGVCDKILHL